MQYFVEGQSFRNQNEYELALKDKAIIDKLKATYDLKRNSDVISLYNELKDVHFNTIVGNKFDDEIYELYEEVKSGKRQDIISDKKKKEKKTDKRNNKTSTSINDIDPKLRSQVIKEIKRRNLIRNLIVLLLVLVAAGSLGYFGVYYRAASEKDKESQQFNELKDPKFADVIQISAEAKRDYDEEVVIPEILDEYKVLFNKNKSLIGWVKIADTIIDYPVMQAEDNQYYLNYNFENKKDANGCIFLDTNCDVILGNTNWILYGHHMNNGKMFSSLIKYANKDFYEKHKTIQFDTIYEKGEYEVMYAFRSRVYTSDEIVFKYYQFIDAYSCEEFDSYMEEMSKISLIDTGVTAQFGDQLLTLSTCDYQEQNGRFVVVAKKIK